MRIGDLMSDCLRNLYPDLAEAVKAITADSNPCPDPPCNGRTPRYATQFVRAMQRVRPLDTVPTDCIADAFLAHQFNQRPQSTEEAARDHPSGSVRHFNFRLEGRFDVNWAGMDFLFPFVQTGPRGFLCIGFQVIDKGNGRKVAEMSVVSPDPMDEQIAALADAWAKYFAFTQRARGHSVKRHISHEGAFYDFLASRGLPL